MSTKSSFNESDHGKAILSKLLLDTIAAAFNKPASANVNSFEKFRKTFNKLFDGYSQLPDSTVLEKLHTGLIQTDLDRLGERARVQAGQTLPANKRTKEAWNELTEAVPELHTLTNLSELLDDLDYKKRTAWRLFFATRPLGMTEINQLAPKTQRDLPLLCEWLAALRGNHAQPVVPTSDLSGEPLVIRWATSPAKPLVAITSFKTNLQSWNGRVMGRPDLSRERFNQLAELIRNVGQLTPRPHYVVFPELSIPREWIMEIASSLHRSGISLIAGVEYEIDSAEAPKKCHNPVFMFLRSTDLGYKGYRLIRQDKTIPALEEENELRRRSHLELTPKVPYDFGYTASPDAPRPVFQHGDFHFGILICNELTNIDFRSSFRGKVDALFAIEWNRDLKTFSPLVESTANDVHCFIVQVNNREYGDSRIRIPAKDDWKRDVVRLQGGENDYVVVGELDVPGLRMFQSHHRSSVDQSAKFKPVPAGFRISPLRSENPLLHKG